MNRQKSNQCRQRYKQRFRPHMARFPRVGVVLLAPSRASTTPFCAYYGPHGETCSNTADLETVFTLPAIPPYQYMACPLHRDAVCQSVQKFLANLEQGSGSRGI